MIFFTGGCDLHVKVILDFHLWMINKDVYYKMYSICTLTRSWMESFNNLDLLFRVTGSLFVVCFVNVYHSSIVEDISFKTYRLIHLN